MSEFWWYVGIFVINGYVLIVFDFVVFFYYDGVVYGFDVYRARFYYLLKFVFC